MRFCFRLSPAAVPLSPALPLPCCPAALLPCLPLCFAACLPFSWPAACRIPAALPAALP